MEGTEPVEPVAMTIPLEAEVKATPLVKLAKTPEEEAPIEPEAALMSGLAAIRSSPWRQCSPAWHRKRGARNSLTGLRTGVLESRDGVVELADLGRGNTWGLLDDTVEAADLKR
jgi:hypothetical protein